MAEPIRREDEVDTREELEARAATGLFGCLFLPGVIMVVVFIVALVYLIFFRTGGA